MNNNEHRPAFSNPHWKADESCVKEPDSSESDIRIPVRALNIIWGNDSRFWQWIKLTEEDTKSTEFEEGTVLLQVNWIQVTGKLSVMPCMAASATTEYEIVYIVKFRADAFGWHSVPIKFKVRFNGEERVKSVVFESYRKKQNEWHEISGGIFTVSDSLGAVVEFGMFEDESDWWKGGLVLAGIKIRPKLG